MRDCNIALAVTENQRLGVFAHTLACGGVAHVRAGHRAVQLRQNLVIKNVIDKSHILVMGYVAVVVHGNTAAFLTAVLQGVKSVVRASRAVTRGVVYCEYSAFLAEFFILNHRKILSLAVLKVIHN